MFNIVLVNPKIPPNTGNIIRISANTGSKLHLIEPLGFQMEDKLLRRAGLDYHEYAQVKRYKNWEAFLSSCQPNQARIFCFSTKGSYSSFAQHYDVGDWLVFGSETRGLPPPIRYHHGEKNCLYIPMHKGQRSLNLANAVAITVYEAWRQCRFVMNKPNSVAKYN
jgi:tRNA (cytidine/uridine-2'-O-)-methyltransferase